MRKFIFLLLFVVSNGVSASLFPVNIQNCMDALKCIALGDKQISQIDGNLITAQTVIKIGGAGEGTRIKTLVEYELGNASSRRDEIVELEGPSVGNVSVRTSSITGSLWLELDKYIFLSDQFQEISLHFTHVVPADVRSRFGFGYRYNPRSDLSEVKLLIDTSALLAGTAGGSSECCEMIFSGPSTLFNEEGFPTSSCVAQGCFSDVELNLLGLDYVIMGDQAEVVLASDEHRRRLFYLADGYDEVASVFETYTLRTVPIMGALPLFLSAGVILSLCGFRKRR